MMYTVSIARPGGHERERARSWTAGYCFSRTRTREAVRPCRSSSAQAPSPPRRGAGALVSPNHISRSPLIPHSYALPISTWTSSQPTLLVRLALALPRASMPSCVGAAPSSSDRAHPPSVALADVKGAVSEAVGSVTGAEDWTQSGQETKEAAIGVRSVDLAPHPPTPGESI